jgi:hypothetical protein
LVGGVPALVSGEEEVDTSLGPVHVTGAITESLHTSDLFLEVIEETV